MDLSHRGKNEDLELLRGSSVAIGVFDGCHVGHVSLIESCIKDSAEDDRKSVIVTFDIDPDELFVQVPEKIMTNKQRIERLSSLGASAVIPIKFNENLASMEPNRFLDMIFGDNLPNSIHIGIDFRFGRGKLGDIDTLKVWCDARGVKVFVHDLVEIGGDAVKSTRIRRLLESGDIEQANILLGSPYTVCGPVIHGRGEGASFGFATANIEASCLLSEGVYAGYAKIGALDRKAAISVGIPPTFKDRSKDSLEVHILDYEGDLYGKDVCISFIERLRPMVEFDSIEDLISQVNEDIAYIKNNL